ncbi:hypothetical protein ADIS_4257 [Lunatimonas lonarensis]|uniref:Uncharacterized protein n=1 Tax=Lunatimonas lonarensis TaxID=1232681 RepID=R7ZLX2_9BACT|nr:hypothetical protein [Lunatimonas lonarensis]EON75086.1 hypothetical protein ADIS_4257 [Lunatimonas lonarensis]
MRQTLIKNWKSVGVGNLNSNGFPVLSKQRLLILAAVLLMFASCDSLDAGDEQIQPSNFSTEIEELTKIYSNGIDIALSAVENYTPNPKSIDLQANGDKLFAEIAHAMAQEMIGLEGHDKDEFLAGFHGLWGGGSNPNARTRVDAFNSGDYFTPNQTAMLDPFIRNVELSDDPFVTKSTAQAFQTQIINSNSLNYEEKLGLLSVSTGTLVYADFVLEGGIDRFRRVLLPESGGEFQTSGCSVNTRSVLADGVVGLVAYATAACYSGATVGTVTFPIVGTVTGCVSAAVVGGAGGFITGVTYGIASQLLTSCFR